jgi:hypothetical protein
MQILARYSSHLIDRKRRIGTELRKKSDQPTPSAVNY